jgi:23S rRNA (adenine2503-C2)-methyltransferase
VTPVETRTDIKSLDRACLGDVVRDLEQPAWRVSQIVRWLYQRGAASFEEMTDLPAELRERLAERLELGSAEVVERQVSRDGTRKYLHRLSDGVSVETVGLPEGSRLTVCFSTQAGCAMGCVLCATGRGGFARDLLPGEMVDQVASVARDFGARVSNAVAMGQGEPFANYDALLAGLRFMNAKDGLGIGARHITVSTCGIVPAIRRFGAEAEQFTLAVSLHSAVQATRDHLMPGMRGMGLDALRYALLAYASTSGRRPTLEYALVAGVNDTDAELAALMSWCAGLPCHVNIIPANAVSGSGLTRPADATVRGFRDALMRAGTEASIRAERGADIDAACGQLAQRGAG